MALLECLAAARANGHDGRHVHLVEGGEHGRGALGLEQALGNRLTTARHALAGLFTGAGCWGLGGRWRSWRLLHAAVWSADLFFDVLAGDATASAGTFDAREIEAVLLGHTPGDRR